MDPSEEIEQLYYRATAQTIQRDLERAIDLLKTLPDEAARERVAVYMDGLAQMRSEWTRPRTPKAPSSAPAGERAGARGASPRTTTRKPPPPGRTRKS